MPRFMFVLNSKSEDIFLDPYSVQAIVPAGRTQCHVILEGGYVVRDVKTGQSALAGMIEKAIEDREKSIPLPMTLGACGCVGTEVQELSEEVEEPVIGEPVVMEPDPEGEKGEDGPEGPPGGMEEGPAGRVPGKSHQGPVNSREDVRDNQKF